MAGLIPKDEFAGIADVTHLAAGGETPMLSSHLGAIQRFVHDKAIGMPGRYRMAATADSARARVASLLGVTASEVALLWNATAGLHAAAVGMGCRPGDNIVTANDEFPSLISVWRGLGVEVRQVGAALDDIARAMDGRTRAVAVSHVSHLTGARSDLATLRAIADRHGARLIVDASHSLGVVPVDGRLCDGIVACCYKWLLGAHGAGVFFVNGDRWHGLRPATIGWNSVGDEDALRDDAFDLKPGMDRFEFGNPGYMSLYVLDNGVARLQAAGAEAIEAHVLSLGGKLRSGLASLGLDLLTPEPASCRAGNICIATPHWAWVEAHLRANGMLTWGDAGRVRISVHAYNDMADVRRVMDAIGEIRSRI